MSLVEQLRSDASWAEAGKFGWTAIEESKIRTLRAAADRIEALEVEVRTLREHASVPAAQAGGPISASDPTPCATKIGWSRTPSWPGFYWVMEAGDMTIAKWGGHDRPDWTWVVGSESAMSAEDFNESYGPWCGPLPVPEKP